MSPIGAEEVFKPLYRWYLDNTHYQILAHDDAALAMQYFGYSSAYGYLALYTGEVNFYCPGTPGQSSYLLDTATAHMSQALICGWENEYRNIGTWLIESINYGYQKNEEGRTTHQVISCGEDWTTAGWFLLDLFCSAYDRTYDHNNAIRPDSLLIYEEILKNWQSEDEEWVDQMVYLMSEYHLEQTQEERSNEEYFSFSSVNYWLFPYEILSWLTLREHKGLNNPKKFSHPLMNTPIAKFYLSLGRPLERPADLPYANEMIGKLKELCPDVKVPLWTDEVMHTDNSTEPSLLQYPTHAPITGKYQAHLPSGHPDEEKIKLNPFAYNTYTQGEPFSYEGLDEYDESLIEWRLREE
jgi:hypothetical protein